MSRECTYVKAATYKIKYINESKCGHVHGIEKSRGRVGRLLSSAITAAGLFGKLMHCMWVKKYTLVNVHNANVRAGAAARHVLKSRLRDT